MLGLFLVVSLGTKMVASLPLLLRGLTLRETIGSGLLFGAPLTLLVVVARIGLSIGQLDDTQAGALVLLAIVTSVIFPLIFRQLFRRTA